MIKHKIISSKYMDSGYSYILTECGIKEVTTNTIIDAMRKSREKCKECYKE